MAGLQAQVEALRQQVAELQAQLQAQLQFHERHVNDQRLLEAILDYMPAGVYVAEVPSCRPVLINRFNREQLRIADIPNVSKENISIVYSVYVAGTDQFYPTERLPIVRAMSGEVCRADDIEIRFSDGTSSYLEVTGAPLYDAQGKVTNSIAITRDITESFLAKEELRKGQDFLRGLIQVQERDRQLLAYEIHDGLVQYLTAAVWSLEAVCVTESLPANAAAMLTKTRTLLRNAMGDARRVLSGLRPPVLDEHGILAAIDYLTAESEIPGQLAVEAHYDVPFERLHPAMENAIFRIVQESLSNIRKHSGATRAVVRLVQTDGELELTVTDDGAGYHFTNVPHDGIGLQGIRKRAELLGGTFAIASVEPHGAQVRVRLPLMLPDSA
jgi:signal transduction histidine kinase